MKISKLSISNFRGIKELEYSPSTTNLLIGPNNSGKTTILRAMDCVLNPYRQWYRPDSVTELDFYDRRPDLYPLSVEAWLDSLESDELAYFDDALEGVGPDGKVVAEAQYPAEALGTNPIVRFRFEAKPDGTGYSSAITYPKPELNNRTVSRADREAVGFLLVPASRDPLRELFFYQNSFFSKLFEKHELQPQVTEMIKGIEHIGDTLRNNPGFESSFNELRNALARLQIVRNEADSMDLAVLSLSQRKVLQALTLQLKALGEGPQSLMPIEMQGSGMQNMVMVTTIFRYIAEDPKTNVILAFEEPEYSLEPFNQRLLAQELRNIKSKRVQLFVTTHSPEIVNAMMGHGLQVLRRIPTGHEIRMASDLEEPVQKSFELNSIFAMTQGLFARRVLLVEGASERSGLPVFLEQLKKEDRFSGAYELGIEMIEAFGIKEIPPYAEVFSAFGTSVAALVDYDAGSTPEKQAENQKRRDDIKKAADYVFQLPDSHEARNYDAVVAYEAPLQALISILDDLGKERCVAEGEFHMKLLQVVQDTDSDLYSKVKDRVPVDSTVKQITNLIEEHSDEALARTFLLKLMSSKGSPMNCKSAREARRVALAVAEFGVPKTFATLASCLEKWANNTLGKDKVILIAFA